MNNDKWMTIKVPEALGAQFLKAMKLANWKLHLESNQNPSQKSERIDCFEYILAGALIELEPEFNQWLTKLKEADDPRGRYAEARYLALERDGYRCVICRASGANSAGVESHHVTPRSAGGEDVPENLCSLCRAHHEQVTNPPSAAWHWRNIAPRLRQLMGVKEAA
jgi:hypothetical protein